MSDRIQYHCYDVSGAYQRAVDSLAVAAEVAGDGGKIERERVDASGYRVDARFVVRDGLTFAQPLPRTVAASTANGTPELALFARAIRHASEIEQYEPEHAEAWREMALAAKRAYDACRKRLDTLERLVKAYQESERGVRDKLESATGSRS